MKKIKLELAKIILLLLLLLFFSNVATGNAEILSKLTIILIIIYELFILLKLIMQNAKNITNNSNLYILITFFILTIVLMEAVFIFIPRSHGAGYTKGARNWFKYYWNTNSYGFRDKEPKKNKKAIFFVGDSFTAGHGIKKVEDRFSDIVGQNLSDFESYNLGLNGINTKSEYKKMVQFIDETKIKPEIIVLQYCGNDIESEELNDGSSSADYYPYKNLNPFVAYLVKGSHLINYIYEMYPVDSKPYMEFISHTYKNDSILQKHEDDLLMFVNYVNKEKIVLIPVIFPFLQDLDYSKKLYVNKIEDFFRKNSVKTINVSEIVVKNNIKNLVVNNSDGHASVDVNKVVANEIINRINNNNLNQE